MNPFYDHFKLMTGGGLGQHDRNHDIGNVYHGVLYQRGYGLGDSQNYHQYHGLGFIDGLAGLFKLAMPTVKAGLKYLGSQAVDTVANIAQDVIAGDSIKDSAERRLTDAKQQIFARAPEAIIQAVTSNKSRGVKRKHPSQASAGKVVASARRTSAKQPRLAGGRIVGKGVFEKYPALQKLL